MTRKSLFALLMTSAFVAVAPIAHSEGVRNSEGVVKSEGVKSSEGVTLNIPETNWQIRFTAPKLVEKYEVQRPNKYVFSAKAGNFNMSVLVETPRDQGNRHEDCYNYYWPKTERSPMIAKSTVSAANKPKYYRVEYDTIVQFRRDRMRQHNVDYYFAANGKWADVHISIMAPTPADDAIIKTFDESLSYSQ